MSKGKKKKKGSNAIAMDISSSEDEADDYKVDDFRLSEDEQYDEVVEEETDGYSEEEGDDVDERQTD